MPDFLINLFYRISYPKLKLKPNTPEMKDFDNEDRFFRGVKGDSDKAKILQGFIFRA